MSATAAHQPLSERLARKLVWLWRLTKGWLPQTFGTLATALSIVWGGYGPDIWTKGGWALVLAIVFAASSLVSQALLQRPSYMELARRTEAADGESAAKSGALEQAFTVLLRKLAEHCQIDSNSDRVSIYYFHDERFVMLARWSTHPTYTRPGRSSYPTGQGAIGDAWDSGSVVTQLPGTRARWEQRLESRHNFAPGSTSALAMHCRSIAALRVESNRHAVGVLVFESIDENRASQQTLDTAKTSMLFATLSELVDAVASMTPRVEELTKATDRATPPAPKWKHVDAV